MRATVMFGAGDVRIESVPDSSIIEPTDAVVTVTQAIHLPTLATLGDQSEHAYFGTSAPVKKLLAWTGT